MNNQRKTIKDFLANKIAMEVVRLCDEDLLDTRSALSDMALEYIEHIMDRSLSPVDDFRELMKNDVI